MSAYQSIRTRSVMSDIDDIRVTCRAASCTAHWLETAGGKRAGGPDRARLQANETLVFPAEKNMYCIIHFPVGISRSEKPIGRRL